ncbi:MAG: hypothetical protein JNL70_12920 [Saprospiraceae bacterium]|nr:hypothetical protein [Saprospiraceae bacterium]
MSPIAIIGICSFFFIMGRFFSKSPPYEQDYDTYGYTHPKFPRKNIKNKIEEKAIHYTFIFVTLLAIALVIVNELTEMEVTIALK